MGNNKVEQTCYNNRLQPIAIRLGSATSTSCSNSGTDLLNLSYGYGTTNNNGNVQSQTIARPSGTWTQSYSYDALNRLSTAGESGTGSWSQNYGYDTVGNRWVSTQAGLPPLTNETPQASTWYLSTNRINGWGYDGSGNLTSISGMAKSFAYDAENRMTLATINSTATEYVYDGEGRRVQKIGPGGTTTYVYDASGQLAAEYGTATDSDMGTRFVTADHLGSTRLKTDSTGAVTNCYDYLPFGEEIASGTAGRTATCFAPTGADTFNIKFTGKERDAETGLDYFAARYLSSAQGRFTSADPIGFSKQKIVDPQQWNTYAYVRNNPLRLVDPTGSYITDCAADDKKCNKRIDKFEKARQKDLRSKDERVRDAAAQYGDRGDDNGVTVRVLTPAAMTAAVGVAANGATIPVEGQDEDRVNVYISSDLGGKDLQRTIAHEGVHLGMDLDFINSFNPVTGRYDPDFNFTHGQTEFLGFMTGAVVKKYNYPNVPCAGAAGCKFGPMDAAKINEFLHNSPVYGPVFNTPVFNPQRWLQQ